MAVKGQGKDLPYAQADEALNTALKKAGVQLRTIEPETKKQPNQRTITATGVHVSFVQPVDAPGVPAQFVDHIVGEVSVDSLATPAGAIPSLASPAAPASSARVACSPVARPRAAAPQGSRAVARCRRRRRPAARRSPRQAPAPRKPRRCSDRWRTSRPGFLAAYLVWQTLMRSAP